MESAAPKPAPLKPLVVPEKRAQRLAPDTRSWSSSSEPLTNKVFSKDDADRIKKALGF
ncbi:hypothetical protein SAMN04489743_2834 [Pseudarthrobacter equi]|uniref:Uncharacterized protein n=1 Tax=Pseudarthrobacter equi TaxID=728066 RepID=A0A1H2A7Z7_9MICC|nr:hypothetical protein [Pseudarthrobacter equi]SDT41987.1 hypothetical protein SAMN04489743_2834 [Pseudarthrobacter equi]